MYEIILRLLATSEPKKCENEDKSESKLVNWRIFFLSFSFTVPQR